MAHQSLTDEALAVLDELDRSAKTSKAPAHSKRSSERLPYRRDLKLQRRDQAGWLTTSWIYARDLSAGGMACLHLEPLDAGAGVIVHLPASAGNERITARVAHCRELKDEWYLLGLAFAEPIDPRRYTEAP